MKKHLFFLLIPFLAVSVWAQSPGTGGRENSRRSEREPVSVSGTLVPANGFIALKSGDTLYYTSGLERLVGFVDGLKENAQVRLEGYDLSRVRTSRTRDTAQSETIHFLLVTGLEIGGRSYELRPAGHAFWGRGPRNFRDRPAFDKHDRRRDFDGPRPGGHGRRGAGRWRGRERR
ncbi:MAG: hypothetical protein LBH35_08860 [Treponema sp.]|nr:hypothetical protein [Treponema sp.]